MTEDTRTTEGKQASAELAVVPDGVGLCARPVLVECPGCDTKTGEVCSEGHRHAVYVRCGTRRRSECASCADLYAGDAYQLVNLGLEGDGSAGGGSSVRAAFVTLTAPGRQEFGARHHFRDKRGARPCVCGEVHGPYDPVLGAPVEGDDFAYDKAAAWNEAIGPLWTAFATYLRRAMPRGVRVEYARVSEPQRRGLFHLHAVVRFDGPWLSARFIERAVKAAARAASYHDRFRFGRADVRVLGSPGVSAQEVSGYLAKYATASASDFWSKHGGVPATGPARAHLDRLAAVAEARAARRMRAALMARGVLSGLQPHEERRAKRIGQSLGFGGHAITKSRGYSTTFTALRARRRAWASAAAGNDGDDEMPVHFWRFVEVGWSLEHQAGWAAAAAAAHRASLADRPPLVAAA